MKPVQWKMMIISITISLSMFIEEKCVLEIDKCEKHAIIRSFDRLCVN